MKFLVFSIMLAIFTHEASAQKLKKADCTIMKEGKFRYLDIEDSTAYFIIRSIVHTEYHRNGQYQIVSDLVWKNSCEYEMTMVSNTIPDFPYKPGNRMLVTILKVEGSVIHYRAKVGDESWEGRLLKIN